MYYLLVISGLFTLALAGDIAFFIYRVHDDVGLNVCMCTLIFIKLHITAQSSPVIYSFYATACNPPGGYLS